MRRGRWHTREVMVSLSTEVWVDQSIATYLHVSLKGSIWEAKSLTALSH